VQYTRRERQELLGGRVGIGALRTRSKCQTLTAQKNEKKKEQEQKKKKKKKKLLFIVEGLS
jgi:hypothetical protein